MLLGAGDPVAGTAVVDSYIKDTLGLDRIVLDHPPGFVHETLGINYNNYVTANDVNKALAMLYGGFVVGENERSYMLDALGGVKPGLNYILGALNGPGVVVGHKNGWFPSNEGYVDNDACIIRFWRGDREYAFAMTFLTQEIAGEYAGVALGQELARMALDYFLAKYPE